MRSKNPSRRLLLVGVVVFSVLTGVGITNADVDGGIGSTATADIASPTADIDSTSLQTGTTTDVTGTVSIVADPNTANATATHTVTITIKNGSANDLSGVVVDYGNTDASVSLAVAKMKAVTLSGRNISDSAVPSSLNGATVRFTFGSDRRLEAGDTLSLVYGGVRNPSETGTYPIDIRINPTNNQTNLTAQLNISEVESVAGTGVDNGDGVATDTGETGDGRNGKEAADGEGGTKTTTTSGPGLTVLVALGCVLGVGVGIACRDGPDS